MMLLNKD